MFVEHNYKRGQRSLFMPFYIDRSRDDGLIRIIRVKLGRGLLLFKHETSVLLE